jgi:hypothetical protein
VIGAFFGLAVALAAAATGPADRAASGGAPGPAVPIEVNGQCPSHDAIMAALLPALGGSSIPSPPRVSDLGAAFEIVAFGQTRQFVDTARDCAERARVAAVFIALALNPPMLQLPPAAAPPPVPPVANVAPPPVVAPPPPPVVAPPPPRWLNLAVGARVDGPLGGAASPGGTTGGIELRGAAGRRAVGVVAAVGVLAPTDSKVSFVNVHHQRFPASLAVMARRALPRGLAVEGAAGLALVPFRLQADGLGQSTPATRVDAGLRLALQVRLPPLARGLTPFLGGHLEYFPRPYVVDVAPIGDIGTTNRVWVGASAGIAFDAR